MSAGHNGLVIDSVTYSLHCSWCLVCEGDPAALIAPFQRSTVPIAGRPPASSRALHAWLYPLELLRLMVLRSRRPSSIVYDLLSHPYLAWLESHALQLSE